MIRKMQSAAAWRGLAMRGDAVDADDLRAVFDALDHGLCVIEVEFNDAGKCVDYIFLEVNAAFESQTGLPAASGQSMRAMRPNHEQHWFDIYGEIARSGVPRRFTAEAAALSRWYDVFAFRLGEPGRRRVAILFDDVTERKQLEERHALMSREVAHRTRNLFALIGGLIGMTKAGTVSEYKDILQRRVSALFSTTAIELDNTPVDFAELVRLEMAPYQAGGPMRIELSGPSVRFDKSRMQCLAVALHELATNAMKHGALSATDGKVVLRWRVENGMLRVEWREFGGPAVAKPSRTGVGTGVIERCICEQLGGTFAFDWDSRGLRCEIAVPVTPDAITN